MKALESKRILPQALTVQHAYDTEGGTHACSLFLLTMIEEGGGGARPTLTNVQVLLFYSLITKDVAALLHNHNKITAKRGLEFRLILHWMRLTLKLAISQFGILFY